MSAFQFCFAQTTPLPTLFSGWERIYIKNVGSFDLPPIMEIQKGVYKEYMNQFNKTFGYDTDRIVAQQTGLNKMGNEGFEKYARVILETTIGNYGDYVNLNFELPEMSKPELNELNEYFKEQIKRDFINTGIRMTEWCPTKFQKINGMSYMKISYKRKLSNSPEVLVNSYYFYNNDRLHTLTLSYRLNESDFWKSDLTKILNSFRITNER
jgi:hypothetical protein